MVLCGETHYSVVKYGPACARRAKMRPVALSLKKQKAHLFDNKDEDIKGKKLML